MNQDNSISCLVTTFFLSSLLLMIMLSTQISFALMVPNLSKKLDCKIANSPVKYPVDVGHAEHYSKLVEKVSIRGADTRRVSENNSSFPLSCETKSGNSIPLATLNLISNKEVVTVLHALVNPYKGCTPDSVVDLNKCYADLGKRKVPLEINEEELIKQCEEKGDSILSLKFKDGAEVNDRKPYSIACSSALQVNVKTPIILRGAFASNREIKEKGPKLKMGINTIEGGGEVYRLVKSTGKIYYSNDSGNGTSGGALEIDGKLVGVHVGDTNAEGAGIFGSPDEKVGSGRLLTAENFEGCK